jgi:hypothetical protein
LQGVGATPRRIAPGQDFGSFLNTGKCVAQKSTDLLRVRHRTGLLLPELVNFSQPKSAKIFLRKVRLIRINISIAIVIAPNIFQARSGKKISSKVC